jgi:hypothetical protein
MLLLSWGPVTERTVFGNLPAIIDDPHPARKKSRRVQRTFRTNSFEQWSEVEKVRKER